MTIKEKIKKIIRWFIPYGIIELRRQKINKDNLQKEKEHRIREYFLNLNRQIQDVEVLEIINYFEKYKFSMFPYAFSRAYHPYDIDVFYDSMGGGGTVCST